MARISDFEVRHGASLFTLFDYYGLAASDASAAWGAAALAVSAVALFTAAVTVFTRRDLSV